MILKDTVNYYYQKIFFAVIGYYQMICDRYVILFPSKQLANLLLVVFSNKF